MAEKPTAAFVLGLIGGIFILLGAIFLLFVGSIFGAMMAGTPGSGGETLFYALGGLGLVSGMLVIVGSAMMFVKPETHTMWGAIVLVFSIVSWAGGGGFFIGFLLALIGGILGLVFKPTPMGGQMGQMGMGGMGMGGARHCTKCGAALPMGATACPNCGSPVM